MNKSTRKHTQQSRAYRVSPAFVFKAPVERSSAQALSRQTALLSHPRPPYRLRSQTAHRLKLLLTIFKELSDSVPLAVTTSTNPTNQPPDGSYDRREARHRSAGAGSATNSEQTRRAINNGFDKIMSKTVGHRWTHVRGPDGANAVVRWLLALARDSAIRESVFIVSMLYGRTESYAEHLDQL